MYGLAGCDIAASKKKTLLTRIRLQRAFEKIAVEKTVLILTDGMADEPIAELGGKTPIEFADTPNMDYIAREGACGIFRSLPEGYPTSSDVANMSVMGYDPAKYYSGRGPLEALSQGIEMGSNDVAWRCNLVFVDGDILVDYSAGHLDNTVARKLITDLGKEFNCADFTFYPGVSYRNILITHGKGFTDKVIYEKPDDSQGKRLSTLLLKADDDSAESQRTVKRLNTLMRETRSFLTSHPLNNNEQKPANMIWLWSPGKRPNLPRFVDKYRGVQGAIISAVDVIFGLGKCAGMNIIKVPGATGFIDTNYEGKADAAVKALNNHDFVYLHVEAADECSHMGDLQLKLKAIEDIDKRLIGRLRDQLGERPVTLAVLPDHPVPIRLRVHTRDPVPVAICGPHISKDHCQHYSERIAKNGALGRLEGDKLMKLILNCP